MNGFFFKLLQLDLVCCAAELTLRLYFVSMHFSTKEYVLGFFSGGVGLYYTFSRSLD